MPRRRKKDRKRREKRLERLPEKLQRKRERRVAYRIRRMPSWIKLGLVVALIAVIIGGAAVAILILNPLSDNETIEKSDVYFLQKDIFYCNVNNISEVSIDYMEALFGIGTYNSDQPLNVIVIDTFDENRNMTVGDYIVYDYFGNTYLIDPTIESRKITYNIGGINPAMVSQRDLGGNAKGYWSLLFGYTINSSNDESLATDDLSDMFTFNFSVSVENDTLVYGNSSIVHCNITLNTLPSYIGMFEFSDGRAYIEFPKTIYNDSTLIANISLLEVQRVGTISGDAKIDNESLIAFETDFTVLDFNASWGFTFDLNVTAYTNNSFCLLDFTSPVCEFYIQSGYRDSPALPDQPMHFPNATLDIRTEYENKYISNYTDIFISLPQVWVDVSPPNSTPPYAGSIVTLRVPASVHRSLQIHRLSKTTDISSLADPFPIEDKYYKASAPMVVDAINPDLTELRRVLTIH
ncbi:MAG: hypothetical protein ACFFDP_12455 [Promethearchaeota archaeon]